ncbi:MAG: HPr kinase/phosphatase C-terminal domain-containing protein [Alphaproteobacteria bacterium]|nr:HPr kinase/phosphatase C-terminal domain-containing protein [Alphaproteobacteria bacterium]
MTLVHATAVALDGQGVLLLGPSGSGKSDLALRLIDAGALLISDDQVEVSKQGDLVVAAPPAPIAGLIEARGIGLVRLPYLARAVMVLAVELVAAPLIERLPEPATWTGGGVTLPLLKLDPFAASAPAKLRLALMVGPRVIMSP